MKKLFSHLIFVKIIEFRSFLENSPETALQFPFFLLRTSRTTKFRILELLVENGKPSPGEIRQEQDAWGGWEQLHVTHGCAERGTQGGQKGLIVILDIQNRFLQRSKQFGPKLR